MNIWNIYLNCGILLFKEVKGKANFIMANDHLILITPIKCHSSYTGIAMPPLVTYGCRKTTIPVAFRHTAGPWTFWIPLYTPIKRGEVKSHKGSFKRCQHLTNILNGCWENVGEMLNGLFKPLQHHSTVFEKKGNVVWVLNESINRFNLIQHTFNKLSTLFTLSTMLDDHFKRP